jgi:hypothetical protein
MPLTTIPAALPTEATSGARRHQKTQPVAVGTRIVAHTVSSVLPEVSCVTTIPSVVSRITGSASDHTRRAVVI